MYIEELEDKPQQKWGTSMMKHLFYMSYLYILILRPTLEFFNKKIHLLHNKMG